MEEFDKDLNIVVLTDDHLQEIIEKAVTKALKEYDNKLMIDKIIAGHAEKYKSPVKRDDLEFNIGVCGAEEKE